MKYVRRLFLGLVIVLFLFSLFYNLAADEFNWAWVSFMAFVLLSWIGVFWVRGKVNDKKEFPKADFQQRFLAKNPLADW